MPTKLFKPGESGNPKGKPKGLSNYRVRIQVWEKLKELNFDPFVEAINLYKRTTKDNVKANILMDLCSYIAPKLRHIDIGSDMENPFHITLNIGEKKVIESNSTDNQE